LAPHRQRSSKLLAASKKRIKNSARYHGTLQEAKQFTSIGQLIAFGGGTANSISACQRIRSGLAAHQHPTAASLELRSTAPNPLTMAGDQFK
jgi:hypothetical protein